MDMQPSSYDDYDYSYYPPPPPYYPPYNHQYYGGGGYPGGDDDSDDSDDADDGDEGRDDDNGDDSGDDDGDDSGNNDDGDGGGDGGDDRGDDDNGDDYSYYPPPPPYYSPYNDQYYGGGSYRGGDDDNDDVDDGDEGRDDDDDGGDDSDDDDDGGDDSDDDDDGGDDSGDDDGDDSGNNDDGDDSGNDDDSGNGDDSEEDSSEEYDDDEYDDGNDTDEYDHDDEDPDSGGTTNIGVIHGEHTILAVDSRASKNGVYKRDGKKKMIKLTESIVLTRVGKVGVSKALWEHLRKKLRKTRRYLTIEKLAKSGKEFADTITDDASGKCFIGGIEGGHPILYSFGYHYDKVLGSGWGFQRKIETFHTMGSGMVFARSAYVKGMARRGGGVSIDDVKEEVTFALLKAALEDGSTGGMLHVAQVSPTVGYQVTSKNSIESYVRFFDRLGATNESAVLAVYEANQVSKQGVSGICSDYGTVVFEGHPLAKLRGNYYIQRVVFEQDSSVDYLIQMAEVDRGTRVQFSSERRLKYLSLRIGYEVYKIYVARCSVTFLENLNVLDE